MRLGVVHEGLGAVAALEQERLALGDGGQALLQPVDLGRHRDRRDALQDRAHVADVGLVGPLGLLGGGTGQRVVQLAAQLVGQGRQLG